MENIKQPAVAGTFYPSDADELRQKVQECLSHGLQVASVPKAIIAPHAGYQFSGQIAGSAYAVMQHVKDRIKRVVLLGPSHYVGFNGFAIPSYTHFATPLGNVPVDRLGVGKVSCLLEVQELDQAFEKEHSLEVQLPFLQELFTDFTIVPVLVGQAEPQAVASVIAQMWGGPETLIVISSDLSHYHDYNTAWKMDLQTTRAIELAQFETITNEQACGRIPIKGMLSLAREIGLTVRAIDVRNSGDTYGKKERVVGYGAYHFYPTNEKVGIYNTHQKQSLLKIARNSIEHGLQHGKPLEVEPNGLFKEQVQRATFVSLYLESKLRGCVGSLQAVRHLAEDVATNAFKAAFEDKRFKPLTSDEFEKCTMSISLLSPLSAIEFSSEEELLAKIRPGIDGLILQDEKNVGTFLPMVWHSHHEPNEFWRHLKLKANLPEDHWSDTIKVFRFTADTLH